MPAIPEAPAKAATAQYTFTFAGWDNEVVSVTGNATYTATYDATVNKYTVTFFAEDGETVLDTQEVEYGAMPVAPAAPEKAADNTYTYTFNGWNVVEVTGDATYTASFTANYIEYTVTFKNWDGSVIDTQTYHYGDAIVAPAEVPTKAANETFTYEFAGWGDLGTVAGNAEFTATFEESYIEYTITFMNEGEVFATVAYHYGDTVVAPAEVPTKAADGKFEYTFAGWTPDFALVTGNATYTATYDATALYTMANVDALRVAILNGTEEGRVDVNGDGVVNVLDLVAMYNMVA